MINNKDKITLVLTPEYLSMASVRDGKITHAERLYLDAAQWEETWKGGLHLLDQPLRQLLARFGGTNKVRYADLFYLSPGSVCRVDITETDEVSAVAKMKNRLFQSVGRSNPVDATDLMSSDEIVLTLGIADEEKNLQKLYAWLNRSKVVANRMVPSQACVIDLAMKDSVRMDGDTAVLFISSGASVIGFCDNGIPKLARLIEIGYDKLSVVYSRVGECDEDVADSDRNAEQISEFPSENGGVMTSTESTKMLFEHGIPVQKGNDSAPSKIQNLMPSMAPILQRISIEIKQTFRFASSLKRMPSKLIICGPGAAIPNIANAVSQSLDMNVEVIPESKDYQSAELFGEGTVEHAAACRFDLDFELMPMAAREVRVRKSLDSTLKIGAAAVALFIGGQYFYTTQESNKIEQVISKQSGMIDRIELDRSRRESIHAMAGSIGTAAGLIEDTMGKQVNWVGFLSAIPSDAHPLVQVSELQGGTNGFEPSVNLIGVVLDDPDGNDASRVLSNYIKSLRRIPEVKQIEIGSTSKSMIDESTWGLKFTLSVKISQEDGRFSDLVTLGSVSHGDIP